MKRIRIDDRFKKLRNQSRGGLITFITAGDPDLATCAEILGGLPASGADLIELGMPFSDPMADGPAIQAANQRALRAGATLEKTLRLVADFRAQDPDTPLVLMGYFNPIYQYGVEAFTAAAVDAGVDGLIVVDLPPEEDAELCAPAIDAGLNWIRLVAPTTDNARLPVVLDRASGFVYHVSITGITGTRSAAVDRVRADVDRIRTHTRLPVAVGFGIRTSAQTAEIAQIADAAVVGSAVIEQIADRLGETRSRVVESVHRFVAGLAAGLRAEVVASPAVRHVSV